MRDDYLKKIVMLLIASLILISAIPCISYADNDKKIIANGTCGVEDNLTWQIDDTGTLTISGKGEMEDFGFDEDANEWIYPGWYEYADSINTVIVSTDVSGIGNDAFREYESIVNVELPENLEYIGKSAFKGCVNLDSVYLSGSVNDIGDNAFANCSNLIIRCEENSYAHNYAIENSISFILADNDDDQLRGQNAASGECGAD